MATLGDLKTRIILETDRDDMGSGGEAEGALTNAISRAIEFYSGKEFWFNRGSGSGSTTGAVAYIARPAAVRIVKTVSYLGQPLPKVPLDQIEYRTETGLPTRWADNEGNIQFWPIPDAVYALSVYGIAQVDAPTTDGQTTIWTVEAYDLIVARVRLLLYRDVFRDTEAAQLAKGAEDEELSNLRREGRAKAVTGLKTDLDCGERFNINYG